MSANNTPANRADTELGTEQQCKACGDWWPLDQTFWHVAPRGRWSCVCKDCTKRIRRGKEAQPIARPAPEIFRAVQWGQAGA